MTRLMLGLAVLVLGLGCAVAEARINDDGDLCWSPDIEFPVPCDDDE